MKKPVITEIKLRLSGYDYYIVLVDGCFPSHPTHFGCSGAICSLMKIRRPYKCVILRASPRRFHHSRKLRLWFFSTGVRVTVSPRQTYWPPEGFEDQARRLFKLADKERAIRTVWFQLRRGS